MHSWFLVALSSGCALEADPSSPKADDDLPTATGDDDGSTPVDRDGDGWRSDVDCNDDLATVHPNADETCDGVDEDCDGEVDESAVDVRTWFVDADSDGYGDPSLDSEACEAPFGYVADSSDCDDTASARYPGAAEICDGLDNDCDETTLEAFELNGAGFPSLNDAVAASVGGDTVLVCDGTFRTRNVEVRHALTIESASGDRDLAVLDAMGGQATTILDVDANTFTLRGLTLTGATASALRVERGSLVVSDARFTDNYGDAGGVWGGDADTLEFTDVEFLDNSSWDNGGGLACWPETLTLTDVLFDGNEASAFGGGMYVGGWSAPQFITLTRTTYRGNMASTYWYGLGGGAIALESTDEDVESTMTMFEVVIEENEADVGGGVWTYGWFDIIADDATTVEGNQAFNSGGGAFLDSREWLTEWTGGAFVRNEAEYGGGLYGFGDAYLHLTDVALLENVATYSGGGAVLNGTDVTLTDVVVEDNSALTGGGLYFAGTEPATLTDVEIRGNEATTGAGLYVSYIALDERYYEFNTLVMDGGAVIENTDGSGMFLEQDVIVDIIDADFGSDTTENLPADVVIEDVDQTWTGFGASASFACSAAAGICQ